MDDDRRIPQLPRREDRGAPHRRRVEEAFAVWLEQKLHELYDSVTREPLPPELLRLIEGQGAEHEPEEGAERKPRENPEREPKD
ncbi:hypothetical protein [Falsiroseomonas sp.]|uniref:hypothetical protein n=1 Tax=Falsiroseomonas sp. TaxID=2870721 RepID=UPI0035659450